MPKTSRKQSILLPVVVVTLGAMLQAVPAQAFELGNLRQQPAKDGTFKAIVPVQFEDNEQFSHMVVKAEVPHGVALNAELTDAPSPRIVVTSSMPMDAPFDIRVHARLGVVDMANTYPIAHTEKPPAAACPSPATAAAAPAAPSPGPSAASAAAPPSAASSAQASAPATNRAAAAGPITARSAGPVVVADNRPYLPLPKSPQVEVPLR